MMSALFLDGTEAANMNLFIELITGLLILLALVIAVASLMIMYNAENKCEEFHAVSDCHWIAVPVEIEKE